MTYFAFLPGHMIACCIFTIVLGNFLIYSSYRLITNTIGIVIVIFNQVIIGIISVMYNTTHNQATGAQNIKFH
jgi:hypothetical protein